MCPFFFFLFCQSDSFHFDGIQAYGDWSDISHIQEEEECLLLKTNQVNTSRYKEIEVTLSVSKLATANYDPRSTETKIEASPYDQ